MNRERALWLGLPLIVVIPLLFLFWAGMGRDDTLPSALAGRPAPEFTLPGLAGKPGLATGDLVGGGVKLVNVWASWCVPCRYEHPKLMKLAAQGVVIHGLNYKDKKQNAEAFLAELGNPYSRIGADTTGRTGLEFGVYGVPETYVINARGVITYRHVGPLLSRNIDKLRAAIGAAAIAE